MLFSHVSLAEVINGTKVLRVIFALHGMRLRWAESHRIQQEIVAKHFKGVLVQKIDIFKELTPRSRTLQK